jgi:nicotinate-nucleotide pyrophosphorylase (carboxylating)
MDRNDNILATQWAKAFNTAMDEDQSQWDWTARAILSGTKSKATQAQVIAKSDCIWAGQGLLDLLPVSAESHVREGEWIKSGAKICTLRGQAQTLLRVERPFLNVTAFVSGIATATRELVDVVVKSGVKPAPRVTSTRKTLPGLKDLSIHGVMVGGGVPHRLNLSGGVLIKENHIRAAGSIEKAIQRAQESAPHVFRIEVEVTSLKEFKTAVIQGAEIIMLDNFSPVLVGQALVELRKMFKDKVGVRKPLIEVSGGLNLRSLHSYCLPGVDILSVGGLTHSVKSCDFSLLF